MCAYHKVDFIQPITKEYNVAGISSKMSKECLNTFFLKLRDKLILKKRPGLIKRGEVSGVTTVVTGGYYWSTPTQNKIIWISGNVVSYMDNTNTITQISTDIDIDLIERCYFASNEKYVAFVNGKYLFYTDGISVLSKVTTDIDIDIPVHITHIDELDGYLILLESGQGQFWWMDFIGTDTPTSIYSGAWATAEYKNDPIIAMTVFHSEIVLFGTQSIEFWASDGVSPFSRINGKTMVFGILSKHAFCKSLETLFFIDNYFHLVAYNNNQRVDLSGDIISDFYHISIWEDTKLSYFNFNGQEFIDIHFPSEQRTIIYHINSGTWHEWTQYNVATAIDREMLVSEFVMSWNKIYAGASNSGSIYQLDDTTYKDDTKYIHFSYKTGNIDYDTSLTKQSNGLMIQMIRGIYSIVGSLLLRWKNDNVNSYSNDLQLRSGNLGDTNNIVKFNGGTGIYRNREWHFHTVDDIPIEISNMEEDVILLNY